jgi:protein gp37
VIARAQTRFVSFEPLIGPIEATSSLGPSVIWPRSCCGAFSLMEKQPPGPK